MQTGGGEVSVSPQAVQLPEKWATPEMLKWAREQVGLSIDQAANFVQELSPERLLAWESGKESPTLQDLETLGELYDCPVGYFFLELPPPQTPPRLDFRGMSLEKLSHLSYESRLQVRRFTRLVDYAVSLITVMGLDWKVSLSTETLEDAVDALVSRAVGRLGVTFETLSELATDEEAFDLWRTKIEKQGVFVFSLRLDPGELRGASLWGSTNPPAILVNRADVEAATGRTFTLLHEYAHLLVKRPGIVCDFRGQAALDTVERFANRFAARAIVPQSNFERLLAGKGLNVYRERWSDEILDQLRRPYHASRDVVSILLEELSYAPKGFYHQKRGTWDRRRPGGRGRGGGQPLATRKRREFGSNFPRLLDTANRRSAISKLDLAEILDMKVEQAEKFLEPFRDSTLSAG